MVSSVVGAVAGGLVNKVLGGGGGSSSSSSGTTSRPTSQPVVVPGSEFQPFTYTGVSGGVTGTPSGDRYSWKANIPQWVQGLGAGGQVAAEGLFSDYYRAAKQDPYAAAEEFYQRGLATLEPEFARQQIEAQERMFGGGRLGLRLAGQGLGAPRGTGAISPDAYGLGAAQSKALTDLYSSSLTQAQALQTNRMNQLSQAAEAAKNLGLLPMMTEQDLVKFAANLEAARSNALKSGTQMVEYGETPQSVFAGQVAPAVGQAVGQAAQSWWSGTPSNYTGTWTNPDSPSSSVSNFFGGLFS
jgi:hypothetical protein